MFQFIPMQAEISLAAIMVILLLADLIMKEPHHKTLQTISCGLLVVQIILNIQPSAGEYFGGMYSCTPVASVVKTILTAGTLLVFMQAGEWISRQAITTLQISHSGLQTASSAPSTVEKTSHRLTDSSPRPLIREP